MLKLHQKIIVRWHDTSVFSPKRKAVALSHMETIGYLEKDDQDFVIIRNPMTINSVTRAAHPNSNPTFYVIPCGMIESITATD